MNLRLKTLGLTLIAALAFTALAAPNASATKEFRAEENANLTVDDNNSVLHVPGTGSTSCTHRTYTGTVGTKASEVTIAPSYTGCTTAGAHTIVDMNGCHYTFTLHTGETSTAGGGSHTHGPVHITCPEDQSITLTVTAFGFNVCTVHVPPQTPTSPTVDYKEEGETTTRDIRLTSTVKGITTVSTNTGGGCATGVHHNGEFTADVTVKGYKQGQSHTTGNHVGIWVE